MGKKRLKLKSDADYEDALVQLDKFWNAVVGSPDEEYLNLVTDAIDAYEDVHYNFGKFDAKDNDGIETKLEGLAIKSFR